ncbi:MAG: copper chaperone PCu(A)C [Thermomicrobiales bacterium]
MRYPLLIFALLTFVVGTIGGTEAVQAQESSATPEATPDASQSVLVSMVIDNSGCMPDRLISAESPVAARILLLHAGDDDIADLEILEDGIDVPAGTKTDLGKNGSFLLLDGLTTVLEPGDEFSLTLTFKFSVDVTLYVTIADPAAESDRATPSAPTLVNGLKISGVSASLVAIAPDDLPEA